MQSAILENAQQLKLFPLAAVISCSLALLRSSLFQRCFQLVHDLGSGCQTHLLSSQNLPLALVAVNAANLSLRCKLQPSDTNSSLHCDGATARSNAAELHKRNFLCEVADLKIATLFSLGATTTCSVSQGALGGLHYSEVINYLVHCKLLHIPPASLLCGSHYFKGEDCLTTFNVYLP